jgi:bifunctional oligoribonuclease and PAP phosphatase NrnA
MNLQKAKKDFIALIEQSNKIILTTHKNPDGDAIGSVLSLKYWFTKYYPEKDVRILITGTQNDVWKNWQGAEDILWVPELLTSLDNTDLLIVADACTLNQITNLTEKPTTPCKIICVDHHPNDPMSADLIIRDATYAACCQLIADFLFSDDDIAKESAVHLLRGVVTDTGSFRYIGSHNAHVLPTAKRLIELGKIDQLDVVMQPLEMLTEKQFAVLNAFMKNTTNVSLQGIPSLTYSFIEEQNFEGLADEDVKKSKGIYTDLIIRQVEGHQWGFTVNKRDAAFSISFRSRPGGPDCSNLGRIYFGGGGHVRAGGGVYIPTNEERDITAQQVSQKIIEILKTAKIEYV